MTTFLTKAQREFLIDEYMEQLEEFDQLDEYPNMDETLRACGNVEFLTLCVEFMPFYGEPAGRKILANIK